MRYALTENIVAVSEIVRWPQGVHTFTPRTNKRHGKETWEKDA